MARLRIPSEVEGLTAPASFVVDERERMYGVVDDAAVLAAAGKVDQREIRHVVDENGVSHIISLSPEKKAALMAQALAGGGKPVKNNPGWDIANNPGWAAFMRAKMHGRGIGADEWLDTLEDARLNATIPGKSEKDHKVRMKAVETEAIMAGVIGSGRNEPVGVVGGNAPVSASVAAQAFSDGLTAGDIMYDLLKQAEAARTGRPASEIILPDAVIRRSPAAGLIIQEASDATANRTIETVEAIANEDTENGGVYGG